MNKGMRLLSAAICSLLLMGAAASGSAEGMLLNGDGLAGGGTGIQTGLAGLQQDNAGGASLNLEQQRALYLGALADNLVKADLIPAGRQLARPTQMEAFDLDESSAEENSGTLGAIDANSGMPGTMAPGAGNGANAAAQSPWESKKELERHHFKLKAVVADNEFQALLAEGTAKDGTLIGIIAVGHRSNVINAFEKTYALSHIAVGLFGDKTSGTVAMGMDSFINKGLAQLSSDKRPAIVEFAPRISNTPNSRLIITGHRLGGSAVLLAAKLLNAHYISRDNLYVATFGQLLLANNEMGRYLTDLGLDESRYLRVVRSKDQGQNVPLPGGFNHFVPALVCGEGTEGYNENPMNEYLQDVKNGMAREFVEQWRQETGAGDTAGAMGGSDVGGGALLGNMNGAQNGSLLTVN